MGEIATHSMIKDKTSFGSTGTECPVKTTIKSISSYIVIANESTYGSPECVKIEDISALQYTFSVNPWQLEISGDGGTSNAYGITSNKTANGTTTNVSWTIDATSIPSWLTHNAASKTFTAGINTTGAQRQVNIYFDQAESGLRDHCVVTQPKRTDVYVFTANPTSLDLDAVNGKGDIDITSTLNGSSVGWAVTKQPDSWCTVKDSIDGLAVSATDNTSASERSTTITLTQTGSGNTLSITIKQSGAVTEWKYFFSVNTTSHNFSNSGGSYSFTITSYKQYYVNGSASGSAVTLPYTSQRSSGDSAFTMSGSTVSVSANTTHSKRVAIFSLTQTENGSSTGKSLILSVDQDPADDEYEFAITWTSGSNYAQTISTTYPSVVTASDYKTFYIRSRKNGATFNSITGFTSDASWITVTSTTSFTYSISENTSSSSRTGTLTLTQGESGKKCYIVITQQRADVEEWRYTFNVNPTALTFDSTGGSQSLTVTCYKTKWINDVEQPSTKTPVDWYSEPKNSWLTGVDAPNSQGGGVGSCGINADANSGIYRSGEVIITNSETQFSTKIIVNQAAYVPDVYVFTWNAGDTNSKIVNVDWNVLGFMDQTSEFKVISTKNGSSHPYSLVSKPSWVTSAVIDSNGISIDISSSNPDTSDRTGNLIFEQDDSGNRLVVVLTQKGQEVSYEFAWDDTNPTVATFPVTPGFNLRNIPLKNILSKKSSDGWATESLVGASVTTKPSWATATIQQNLLDKTLSLILSGYVPTEATGQYLFYIVQDESNEIINLILNVEKPENIITITNITHQTGTSSYKVGVVIDHPASSALAVGINFYTGIGSGNSMYAVVNIAKGATSGYKEISFTGQSWTAKFITARLSTVTPTSDDDWNYTLSPDLYSIGVEAGRFEVGITNNSTGAPVSVTLQGGKIEISTEDVPIGGSVWSGWADSYVNGIVNLKHDYASGDYFYVGVHREDGRTGWIVCEWSESGASTALNGYLTIYEHADDNEVQVIVNNNVDGYIPEGTFGVLNIELNDRQRISVIFEHHPNL